MTLQLVNASAIRALWIRELRGAVINRYMQVFAALSSLAGIAALTSSEDATATGAFILQVAIYFVSLFAVLTGVSSAHAERAEWPLLFSQPVARSAYVLGKFTALLAMFAAVLLLVFLPPAFGGSPLPALCHLLFGTLLLAAVFLALGIAAGFAAHDRAQALIVAVSAWLFLLVGIDLVALFAARWPFFQAIADAWVGALMANPLDAFRIGGLFALQQIPAEAADKTPLANWWIAHARLWFTLSATAWAAALLSVATARINAAAE